MGRPKLARTKEQIAIRLSPGTKARLAALLRSLSSRGSKPIRSEVLRQAIERGLGLLEAEAHGAPAAGGVAHPALRSPAGARETRLAAARAPAIEPAARPRPAPPPPRIPIPSTSRAPSVSRRSPIPGTLADRAYSRLQELTGGERGRDIPVPQLCKAAWPPNPARVRDALAELVDLGLIELRPAPGGTRQSPTERDLIVHGSGGAMLGLVRML